MAIRLLSAAHIELDDVVVCIIDWQTALFGDSVSPALVVSSRHERVPYSVSVEWSCKNLTVVVIRWCSSDDVEMCYILTVKL
jgi:hypothetical protein